MTRLPPGGIFTEFKEWPMSANIPLDTLVARHGRSILLFAVRATVIGVLSWRCLDTLPAMAGEVDAVGVPSPIGFADIVDRIKSTVLAVRVQIEGAASEEHSAAPDSRRFGTPIPDSPTSKVVIVLGSGFFISSDGYIVTNNHVVDNGKSFEVTTDTGKTYQAKVVGTDPQTDLALIKVSASVDFPYVRFASGETRVGDWVLAVGNPYGFGGTVTAGIVSARGRDIGAGPYDDFLQIDAPVNKGNSGGPSFNVKGEVVGVNTAIVSPSGGSVGIGFDIPAETVQLVVRQLKETGHVTRGWIGVQLQPVTALIADAVGLSNPQGAIVARVDRNSPAARGGIEIGDIITSVDGKPVEDVRELIRNIATASPGTSVRLGLFRAGQEKAVTVTLGELPRSSAQAAADRQRTVTERTVLGLTLAPASAVAGAGDNGVIVVDVSPTSNAAANGLHSGDVILDVGRRAVNDPVEVSKIVDEARTKSRRAVLLRIKRGDSISFVAVPIG
jgi:serine protease Do